MKPAAIARLVTAVEAKSGFAKSRLADTRRRKRALLDDAARLDEEARGLLDDPGADGADFIAAARRQAAVERAATARRAEAAALDPEIEERRAALKDALREEIAWRRLQRRVLAEMQKRRSSMEEERRESVVLQSRN